MILLQLLLLYICCSSTRCSCFLYRGKPNGSDVRKKHNDFDRVCYLLNLTRFSHLSCVIGIFCVVWYSVGSDRSNDYLDVRSFNYIMLKLFWFFFCKWRIVPALRNTNLHHIMWVLGNWEFYSICLQVYLTSCESMDFLREYRKRCFSLRMVVCIYVSERLEQVLRG